MSLKPIKAMKGEQVIPFRLHRQGEGAKGSVAAEIRIDPVGVSIRVDGYGDQGTVDGYGSPIYIEHYEGKLWVRVWSDINEGDPTHSIDMEGAMVKNRSELV